MEIHAPDKPILTVKEAIVHLAIVTVGILIALGLEGIVEWRHHRALVAEARANLASEMRDNREELKKAQDRFDYMFKKFADAADKVDAMETKLDPAAATALFATPGESYVMYRYYVADLRDASHSTAEATGAFGYMEYSEVKKYADVYANQRDYLRQQTQAASDAITAMALGIGLLKKASPADVDSVRRQLRLAAGNLMFRRDLGRVLMREYDRALGDAILSK